MESTESTGKKYSVDDIFDSLEEDIALGILHPRERLIEEDLCRKYRTKRHVVRQVFTNLESHGLIKRVRNRGVFVSDYTIDEIEHIYAVRKLLECEAARNLPLPGNDEWLNNLKIITEQHTAAIESGDLRKVFRENISFHRVFFSACGNPFLIQLVEDFSLRSHAIRSYTISTPELLKQAQAEHLQMIDFIEREDRASLIELVSKHILPAKNAYIGKISQMKF